MSKNCWLWLKLQVEFLPSSMNTGKLPEWLFDDVCMLGVVFPTRVPTWLMTRSFPFDFTTFDKLFIADAELLVVVLQEEVVAAICPNLAIELDDTFVA